MFMPGVINRRPGHGEINIKTKLTLTDLIIVIFILSLISIIFAKTLIGNKNEKELVIENGHDTFIYPLDIDRTISIDGLAGKTIIRIRDNKFSFISSPCHNKHCIAMGESRNSIACLPNNVVAYVREKKKKGMEFIIDEVTE